MKEIFYEGKLYVVSRQRGEELELVDGLGEIRRPRVVGLHPLDRDRGVVPDSIPFSRRPYEFLKDLRNRREIDIKRRKQSRKGTSTSKDKRDSSLSKGRRKSASMLALESLETAVSAADPETASLLRVQLAMMRGKGKTKKENKS